MKKNIIVCLIVFCSRTLVADVLDDFATGLEGVKNSVVIKTPTHYSVNDDSLITSSNHLNELKTNKNAADAWNNLSKGEREDIVAYGGNQAILDFVLAVNSKVLTKFLKDIATQKNDQKLLYSDINNVNLIKDTDQLKSLDKDSDAKEAWNQLSKDQREDIVKHGSKAAITNFIKAVSDKKVKDFLQTIADEKKKGTGKQPISKPESVKITLKKDDINGLVKLVDPFSVSNKGDLYDALSEINKKEKGLLMEAMAEYVNNESHLNDVKLILGNKSLLDTFIQEVDKLSTSDNNTYKSSVIDLVKNLSTQGMSSEVKNLLQTTKSYFMKDELNDVTSAILNKENTDNIKMKAQKLLKVIESKSSDVRDLSREDKKALMDILEKVSEITKLDVDQLKLNIDPRKEAKTVLKDCTEYNNWLQSNEGKKIAQEIQDAYNSISNKLANIKKESALEYTKGHIPTQNFKNNLLAIYKNTSLSTAMKRVEYKKPDQSAIKNVLKSLETLDTSRVDEKVLLDDLLVLCLLVPSQLHTIIQFLDDKTGETDKSRKLMTRIYQINIHDVKKFVDEHEQKEQKAGKTINLTQGERNDLDAALKFYPYIKPYLDDAEFKDRNDAFVNTINKLNYYLMAILCKHQESIENAGFDYQLIIDLSEDETNRSWCGLTDPDDTIITAPGGLRITYELGDIKGFGGSFNEQYTGYAINSSGRRVKKSPGEWARVNKNKQFYYAYFVYLSEMVNYIEKYLEKGKNLPDSVKKSIEEFIVSRVNKFYNYYQIAKGIDGCINYNKIQLCGACFDRDMMGNYGGGYNLQPQLYDSDKEEVVPDAETIIERSRAIKLDLETVEKFLQIVLEDRKKNNEPSTDVEKALNAVTDLLKYKKDMAQNPKNYRTSWVNEDMNIRNKVFDAFKKEFA